MANEYCTCNPIEFPFRCDRHCMIKGKLLHQHCRLETKSGHKYWNAWEQGSHGANAPADPILLEQTLPESTGRLKRKRKLPRNKEGFHEKNWSKAFRAGCQNLGDVIHREPCSCGASKKIEIYACAAPEVKRCVPLKSNWNKIRDHETRRHIQPCNGCPHYKPRLKFISVEQFATDIQRLIPLIPDNVTSITGVSRSGIYPATMLAMMLHLPLYILRQSKRDLIPAGNGWRLHQHRQRQGINLVIDDTTMTGRSMELAKDILKKDDLKSINASIYCNPAAISKPDIWAVDLPWPHLLEWNIFNSVMSPYLALDFDGILCHDCRPEQDDDGARYLDFIKNAVPRYPVRKCKIPLIVTARIERYRAETMAWLKRWGIECSRLIMHPASTLHERRRDDIARFKAAHYARFARSRKFNLSPPFFIESDPGQARRIAKLAGHAVICPVAGEVY